MTESQDSRDVYVSSVISQVPRLLGLLNRNSCSATFGCFDRNYWHYRVLDTPSARCQEAVLTLVLLHRIAGTDYSGRNVLITWAKAGLNFWLKSQHPNGSFSEWYPNENSFVATAFTSYAVSEALLLLGPGVVDNEGALKEGLVRAGRWLIRTGEGSALNQFAGSALALYNIFLVTGDPQFEVGAGGRVAILQKLQSREGWFAEYGGADIGYLSLTVAYLAKLYRKSRWPQVLDLTLVSIDFIKTFLHRDFTSGGEYCSRLTEYLIPDGFEILASESLAARTISLFVREVLRRGKGVSIFSFDDRYLTYVAYNFLEAFSYGTSQLHAVSDPVEASSKNAVFRNYPKAGFVVVNNRGFEGVVNTHRGGAFKFVFANGATVSDCGTMFMSKTNRLFHSGFWNDHAENLVEKNRIWIRGKFARIKDTPMSPLRNILFRAFQMTLGRMGRISLWLKNVLRNFLIMRPSREKIYYEREIEVKQNLIYIRDTISGPLGSVDVRTIFLGSRDSFLYTPSSKFFGPADLAEKPLVLIPDSHLRKDARIQISRQYGFDGELLDLGMTGL